MHGMFCPFHGGNLLSAFDDLSWYRTHQHMSKKLPPFDIVKLAQKTSILTKITGPYRAF